MRKIAFFDLKEDPCVYIFEKDGRRCILKDTVRASAKGVNIYGVDRALDGIAESYLSVPLSLLNFRVVELPFGDPEKIREVLPFELDSLILGGSGNIAFDAYVLKESEEKHKVLIAYLTKDALKTILDGLKPLNINPKIITSIDLSCNIDLFLNGNEIAGLLLGGDQNAELAENRNDAVIKEINRPVINLRRGEFAYTADTDRTARSLKLTYALAAALLVVFLSDMSLRIITSQRETAAVKDEIRKTYSGLFPNEKRVAGELYQLKAHIKELKDREKTFTGIRPLNFFLDLSFVSGQGAVFSEIIIDRERIIMKGECSSLTEVQKLKGNLERFLTGVNISDTKASAQNRTAFTITAAGRKI